jgi:GTPase SAR1 family protein
MEFKILLVGDSEVGKTSFIKCQQNSPFNSKYTATEGVDITSLSFDTTY